MGQSFQYKPKSIHFPPKLLAYKALKSVWIMGRKESLWLKPVNSVCMIWLDLGSVMFVRDGYVLRLPDGYVLSVKCCLSGAG